jgi:hypothetical protein
MEPMPWEKQRGESAKAFNAFRIYRDLGSGRAQVKVGRILGESGVQTALSQIERWSSQWRWVERCDAWDREQDQIAREQHRAAIADARRVEAMAGTLMLGAAIRRLNGDMDTRDGEAVIVHALDLNEITAGDVVRLAVTGTKLLDNGLGIASDFHGLTQVSGAAVYDLARALLVLATDMLDEGMRAAVGANGDVGSLVAQHQNRLIEEASRLYATTRARGPAYSVRS